MERYNLRLFSLSVFSALLLAACGAELTTDFGNPYIHHVKNDGPKAQAGEYLYFHYKVRLDDSLVENSWERGTPNVYKLPDLKKVKEEGKDVSALVDGLGQMAKGDSLTIYTTVEGMPMMPEGFENYEYVYYELSMIDIKSEEEYQKEQEELQAELAKEKAAVQALEEGIAARVQDIVNRYNNGSLKDSIQTTASGLSYVIHRKGDGAQPQKGSNVKVHYYGVLTDGKMFDNSFRRGDLFTFTLGVGQVIKGWDEGIALLHEGGAATLFVPADLGYGERGAPPTIPGNSELIFYVELEKAL